jgi:methionyl-tRNA formyltransferase
VTPPKTFAFAGIDFLGGVFDAFVQRGWRPVKLFTRPCDGIYDSNDVIVAKARRLKLPIQLSRLKAPDLADLAERECDALVVAGYPWLITGWQGRVAHALNLHPSPLPIGRGPYPLFRAILDGYESWGVTAHVLADGFDTGDILAQETFALDRFESHETLLAKCQLACARVAGRVAADAAAVWERARPQGDGSYWPRATDGERTLDWSRSVGEILLRVRAFGAVETIARLNNKRIFVHAANGWVEPHRHTPGTLVHTHRRHVVVAARDGYVQLIGWSHLSLAEAHELRR